MSRLWMREVVVETANHRFDGRELRVFAEVKQSLDPRSGAASASARVYNLSKATAEQLRNDVDGEFSIRAGYRGDDKLIFAGRLGGLRETRDGLDAKMELTGVSSARGGRALTNRAYRGIVERGQIIQDVVEQDLRLPLRLPLPHRITLSKKIENWSFAGDSARALDSLMLMATRWTEANGVVAVIDDASSSRDGPGVYNLIGMPVVGGVDFNDDGLRVSTMLDIAAELGARIKFDEDSAAEGVYRCRGYTHRAGSGVDMPFETEFDLRPEGEGDSP